MHRRCFALANASMEETAYRGALVRWVMRSCGTVLPVVVQAAAFGLAHGGRYRLRQLAAAGGGGHRRQRPHFGVIALRTESLLLPVALHAALDVPIYYANACPQG